MSPWMMQPKQQRDRRSSVGPGSSQRVPRKRPRPMVNYCTAQNCLYKLSNSCMIAARMPTHSQFKFDHPVLCLFVLSLSCLSSSVLSIVVPVLLSFAWPDQFMHAQASIRLQQRHLHQIMIFSLIVFPACRSRHTVRNPTHRENPTRQSQT